MPLISASEWDAFLSNFPDAHLLQTTAWGALKAASGWEVARVVSLEEPGSTGAQLLFRRLPLGFTLAYIPKGPLSGSHHQDRPADVLRRWQALWPEVDRLCRQRRAVLLKVEADFLSPDGEQVDPPAGFRRSPHPIQPPRTLLVNLRGDEEQLLARMKQKTRYNIRLALKKGVIVRSSGDLELFYRLMQATGERDKFGVHHPDYYRKAYELFYPRGECELLVAEYEREPLAALVVFAREKRAWYFYGASADVHRDRMPVYLLQWEAMRWARAKGCSVYDLWGVPDVSEETLEANFVKRSDGLWGVYRFKRGFGGQLCRAPDPWDRVYQPALYQFYLWWAGRGKRDMG
jgi:lipid II:glycine glycyltransferase (peptidoglycan interpeptide bridge formation enzyme)